MAQLLKYSNSLFESCAHFLEVNNKVLKRREIPRISKVELDFKLSEAFLLTGEDRNTTLMNILQWI